MSNLPTLFELKEMGSEEVQALPVKHMGDLYAEANKLTSDIKAAKLILDIAVQNKYSVKIADKYASKGEVYGAITVDDDDAKIKIDRPKKVDWSADELSKIETSLIDSEWNVEDFITTKLSVSESRFGTMASQFKAMFEPARTVKSGKTKISIDIKE